MPFKAGHGVTQGSPLSAKLINIMVDMVFWEWHHICGEEVDVEEAEMDGMMATLFVILYVGNAYMVSRGHIFLQ